MPPHLVHTPEASSLTPGTRNRTHRLKYTHAAELLLEFRMHNARIGRTICKATDWLEEHVEDDIRDVEDFLHSHPTWGPFILCDSIAGTWESNKGHPHGRFIAQCVQHDMALALLQHPFDGPGREAVSAMLKRPDWEFLSPEAAYVVLAYVNAGHPNPRKFLEKPEVRSKFPADLELARFAAPDFEHELAGVG